jgi:hypothetical protein
MSHQRSTPLIDDKPRRPNSTETISVLSPVTEEVISSAPSTTGLSSTSLSRQPDGRCPTGRPPACPTGPEPSPGSPKPANDHSEVRYHQHETTGAPPTKKQTR